MRAPSATRVALAVTTLVLAALAMGCASRGAGNGVTHSAPARGAGSEKPVVMLFSKHGCWACTEFEPTYRRVKADYAGQVHFIEKDALADGRDAADLGITEAPTLILFVRGRERGRLVGAANADEVRRLINGGL